MKNLSINFIALLLLISTQMIGQSYSIEPEFTGPQTTITFEETEHDFDTINEGEIAYYTYNFLNTGTEPLIISNAKGSCGCTVPYWPKEPIAPGERGEIEVSFNSKGKKGRQSKRVSVYANTDPRTTFLTIKGEVTPMPAIDLTKPEINVPPQGIDLSDIKVATPVEVEAPTPVEVEMDFPAAQIPAVKGKELSLILYPNPTTDRLHLNLEGEIATITTIEIFNASGQLVKTQKSDFVINDTVIYVQDLPAGKYTLTISSSTEKGISRPFIVNKK